MDGLVCYGCGVAHLFCWCVTRGFVCGCGLVLIVVWFRFVFLCWRLLFAGCLLGCVIMVGDGVVLQLVFGLGLVVYCWIWMVWCLCLMPVELLVIVVVLFCYLLSCVGSGGFDLLFLGCLWCVVLVGLFWSCLFC